MKLLTLIPIIWEVFWQLLDFAKDFAKSALDFFIKNAKLFIKWWLFIFIINLFLTILSFFLYTIYYWWAYVLSQFVTQTTLNIIHMWFLGSVIYFIYKFMYKDNP